MSSLSSYAIISQYGGAVVFDTKYATQDYPFYVCADVQVIECMVFEGNKDELLSKVTNKQSYIQLSADSLEKSGCGVEHVWVNADL